ncbi:hypothetical protein BT63DRAFT_449038 [Microthyrium microscopicum]|uniref:LysM domain-containing protein n=1 Tax=Microthyrium microscopicum TaxID=703497 RepID=A0A6A6UP38_9PEZI|nr:hypothetical protein BT63DRAFT_449038 [Microthyrium microscopicum]
MKRPKKEPVFKLLLTPESIADTCSSLENNWSISHDDFLAWASCFTNPSIDCSGVSLAGKSVCMDGPKGPKQPQVSSLTAPIATKSPYSTPIASPAVSPAATSVEPTSNSKSYHPACKEFYTVVEGDSCWAVANKRARPSKISVSDLISWNLWLAKDCMIYADDRLCVGGPSSLGAIPTSSAGIPDIPAATANDPWTPRLPGTANPKICIRYHLVRDGDTCLKIQGQYNLNE